MRSGVGRITAVANSTSTGSAYRAIHDRLVDSSNSAPPNPIIMPVLKTQPAAHCEASALTSSDSCARERRYHQIASEAASVTIA